MCWRLTVVSTGAGFILLVLLVLQACGGKHGGISDPAHPAFTPGSVTLDSAIAEISAAETPTGVDADVYEGLKAELIRVIKETAVKGVSIPPTGEQNEVTSLTLLGNDTEGWRLEWRYVNVGDYDFNSEVNIADLTPIGMHLGATSSDDNWLEACCADGDGNSEVNIADVTPIGQNYQASVAGFKVYGADSPDGSWQEIGTADLPAPPFDPAVPFTYNLAARDYDYYRVVPVDGASTEGTPSGASMVTVETPVVTLGTETQWDTASVGDGGGTLTGPDLGNGPISIAIPAGALAESYDFELGNNDGSVTQGGNDQGAQLIYLTASDFLQFAEPARITVPLPDEEGALVVGFRLLRDGGLSPLGMPDIDRQNKTATFDLHIAFPAHEDHQTSIDLIPDPPYRREIVFLYLIHAAILVDGAAAASCKTGFQTALDGFKVSECKAGAGACSECAYGIGPFCCWYYHNYKPSMGALSTKFSDLAVQRIILSRATMSVVLGHATDPWQVTPDADPQDGLEIVKAAIRKSNGPVFVLCTKEPGLKTEDLMIAYGYRYDSFLVYKPSKPGVPQIVEPLKEEKKMILLGTDDFPMYESFENILLDATDDPPFGGSSKATINITSPQSGENVSGSSARLTGYVTSGDYLVEKLYTINMTLGLTTYGETIVPPTGEFSFDVELQPGVNDFLFFTHATKQDTLWGHPSCVDVPNNYTAGDYWLAVDKTPCTFNGQVIEIKVQSDSPEVPIAGATVNIVDAKMQTTTNSEGNFAFADSTVAPGMWWVQVTAQGYSERLIRLDLPAGETFTYQFMMDDGTGPDTFKLEVTYDDPGNSFSRLELKLKVPVPPEGEGKYKTVSPYYPGTITDIPFAELDNSIPFTQIINVASVYSLYERYDWGGYKEKPNKYELFVGTYFHVDDPQTISNAKYRVFLDGALVKELNIHDSLRVSVPSYPGWFTVGELVPHTGELLINDSEHWD